MPPVTSNATRGKKGSHAERHPAGGNPRHAGKPPPPRRRILDLPPFTCPSRLHALIRQGLYRRGYETELYTPDALRLLGE